MIARPATLCTRSIISTLFLLVLPWNWADSSLIASSNSRSNLRLRSSNTLAHAVTVQRLKVPDLVLVDQAAAQKSHQQHGPRSSSDSSPLQTSTSNQPQAASLINSQDLMANAGSGEQTQNLFECLISFDRKKDKNIIVKWHHDDRPEAIYQLIPELNKRSIAPQYRDYIVPIISDAKSVQLSPANLTTIGNSSTIASGPQMQLVEASFRLVRPTKELGGKYTCSATSTKNDDSKWKKMIVYTPPKSFKLNATRTDIGAQLASKRDRLIQLSQPAVQSSSASSGQVPLVYRMRGLAGDQHHSSSNFHQVPTTISPQVYSTIDYVNVNQQRLRQPSTSSGWPPGAAVGTLASGPPVGLNTPELQGGPPHLRGSTQMVGVRPSRRQQANGVKLICDIDQVFPVPEVTIYSIKPDGSYPDKLATLDNWLERDSNSGLYHLQVTSLLDDDELRQKYGQNEPVYFECLIALTNLELSRYADSKRTVVYRPGPRGSIGTEELMDPSGIEPADSSASSLKSFLSQHPLPVLLTLGLMLITSWLEAARTHT